MKTTYSFIPIRLYIFPLLLDSVPDTLYEQKLVYQVGAIPTKVVCLTQVVSADELKDDEEYEDIMEDMRLEAGKYGIFHYLVTTYRIMGSVIQATDHLLICLP